MKKGNRRTKKVRADSRVETAKRIAVYSFREIVFSLLVIVSLSTPAAAFRNTPSSPVSPLLTTLSKLSNLQPRNNAPVLAVDVVPSGCPMPDAFQNLLELLQTLIETGVVFGIVLAVLGVTTAGILYLLPGQNRDRLARSTFKYTLIGLLIVIVGPSFVGFIVSELNPLCG